MKPGVIAKLANQCAFLYADALKLMQVDTVKSVWPKVAAALCSLNCENICSIVLAYLCEIIYYCYWFREFIQLLKAFSEGN